ncbi:EAL domain-containing protein [Alteromonas sp. ASW11-36]|uniref:EAL domain-containing protein n=1 Tax=Alteromonas arenosi TaxID=3055817 RepID=A0ABT7ST91_9ALTE|nr:EAL domain-containing protein [Alteromonas sp. ASW11-36]MDM7859413.1 EAL domain-containing protein [Alteromonas sp. ASW11-36]
MYCADCESIDDYFFEDTYFWVFVPTVESFGKIASLCGSLGLEAKQETSHCISCHIKKPKISHFLTSIMGALEMAELAGAKVTTTEQPQPPNLEQMARMTTLDVLVNRYKAKWLIDSVDKERYETWYQPIVCAQSSAEQPTIFAHEGLFRIRDETGSIVPPQLAFQLAESSDLLFSLDLVARRSAVENAAKSKLPGKLFINFNPSSIYDPAYCLRATAAAIHTLGMKPEDIVFEVTETHKASDLNHLKGILAFYRSAGFQVALDDIGSGWSGLNLLQRLRPDYVKIDMDLVRDIHRDDFKQNIVNSLIRIAKNTAIKVIAEGVETAEEAEWLHNANADYLQGYLFGKPQPVKQDLSKAAADNIEQSLQPLAKAAQR